MIENLSFWTVYETQKFSSHSQERFCYTCPDIVKEFGKYDTDPAKWIKSYEGQNHITKKVYIINKCIVSLGKGFSQYLDKVYREASSFIKENVV